MVFDENTLQDDHRPEELAEALKEAVDLRLGKTYDVYQCVFCGLIMQTITATDLARNTRKILDTVASGGETFAVERNNVLIARLVPSEPTMVAAQALEGFRVTLTPRQAANWLADFRGSFDETVRDPWA